MIVVQWQKIRLGSLIKMGCINKNQSVALNCKLNVKTWLFLFLSWQQSFEFVFNSWVKRLHSWHLVGEGVDMCCVLCLMSDVSQAVRWGDDGTRGVTQVRRSPGSGPGLAMSRPWLRLRSNLTLRHIRHTWRMSPGPDLSIWHSYWSGEEIERYYWIKKLSSKWQKLT